MSREAMKLALEALEYIEHNYMSLPAPAGKAITALREALAEQPAPVAKPRKQEPVAWVCEASSSDEKHAIDYWPGDVDDLPIGTKLYTSLPAQRTWVGLTDEQIDRLWSQSLADTESETWLPLREFARAIEAKIKEKNQ